ncbi:MAG: hypothetical protein JW801_12915, partial [Bacteroidales bacterium]|nr:hypothetical protein [Bacteroidales bacterium]
SDLFIIEVVDMETGRGVPMVEFRTTSKELYVSDSNGIIAFDDATLLGQEVFFSVFSHGYEFPGNELFLTAVPGRSSTVGLRRLNIAERLYRITGQGIYRDSERAGIQIPIKNQALNGKLTGQDTYINTEYKGKIYWFWGDTTGPANFNGRVSGATSELPEKGGLDPAVGIELEYFVNSNGFSKAMADVPGPGLVWIDWLVVLKNEDLEEQLYAKYSRMGENFSSLEQGIARYRDSKDIFEPLVRIDSWTGNPHSSGHPERVMINNTEYLYIFHRLGLERVRADLKSITNPESYEYFSCTTSPDEMTNVSEKKGNKKTGDCSWKAGLKGNFTASQDSLAFQGWFEPVDILSGKKISVNPASVFWNEYKERWVMIAYEFVGGAWFLEADTPTGPWVYARKIIEHQNYDFYNIGQHPLFDQENGRLIYLEGTYTLGFSGNTCPTPLYDYNQIMYRLNLDTPELLLPAPVYFLNTKNVQKSYLMKKSLDSLELWEQVQDVAFFALPVDAKSEELIPIYGSTEPGQGYSLTTTPPALGESAPQFYALPVKAAEISGEEPISGTWKGIAKPHNGMEDELELSLYQNGEKVTGNNVVSGYFKDGVLSLELDLMGRYALSGRLDGNTLSGEYKSIEDSEKGSWEITKEEVPAITNSPNVTYLYEYSKTGGSLKIYSTNPNLEDQSFIRTAAPLCRVWLNPGTVLTLNYQARTARRR